MASRACPPIGLSLKNALAQGDLVGRCTRRYREWGGTGVGTDAFRRQGVAGGRRLRGRRRRRPGRNSGRLIPALERDPPNPTALIVSNIQCTVGPNCQPSRAVCRLAWLLDRPGETVRENHKRPGGLAVGQRLEHHVVAPLRFRGAVPGPVERNEGAVFIGGRKLAAFVNQHIVGRPMGRESRDRCFFLRADTHSLPSITTVFRGEDELFPDIIVIAFRPTESKEIPSPLRRPVTKRSPGEKY